MFRFRCLWINIRLRHSWRAHVSYHGLKLHYVNAHGALILQRRNRFEIQISKQSMVELNLFKILPLIYTTTLFICARYIYIIIIILN